MNLGHTFAHSLEKCAGYSRNLLHGEAVAIGICMASRLSLMLGYLSIKDYQRIELLLKNFGLPTNLDYLKTLKDKKNNIIKNMSNDKKVLKGKLNFVLCRSIGKAFVYKKEININLLKKTIL